MKRYTHIVGFTPESSIAYFEVSDENPEDLVAVKKTGERLDFREHWSSDWTYEAIVLGRWIQMLDGESPDAARERHALLEAEELRSSRRRKLRAVDHLGKSPKPGAGRRKGEMPTATSLVQSPPGVNSCQRDHELGSSVSTVRRLQRRRALN